jgi:hypothetical protein
VQTKPAKFFTFIYTRPSFRWLRPSLKIHLGLDEIGIAAVYNLGLNKSNLKKVPWNKF